MSKQVIPGNNALSIDGSGWVLFKRPHGTFYSLADQAIADPTATPAQVLAFENETDNEGLIHSNSVNNSRVYVPTAGSYEIIFSGIATLTSGNDKNIHVWLKVDGADVLSTNTIVNLYKNANQIVAVAFIVDLTAGQYVELATWGETTACVWNYTAAVAASAGVNPYLPACPSVIMTVKKISSRLSYE